MTSEFKNDAEIVESMLDGAAGVSVDGGWERVVSAARRLSDDQAKSAARARERVMAAIREQAETGDATVLDFSAAANVAGRRTVPIWRRQHAAMALAFAAMFLFILSVIARPRSAEAPGTGGSAAMIAYVGAPFAGADAAPAADGAQAYDSLSEALAAAPEGGTISIHVAESGATHEALRITKRVRLQATGGPVTIGRLN